MRHRYLTVAFKLAPDPVAVDWVTARGIARLPWSCTPQQVTESHCRPTF
jgi:hypothetical protein